MNRADRLEFGGISEKQLAGLGKPLASRLSDEHGVIVWVRIGILILP
jgi:hypothetical protein